MCAPKLCECAPGRTSKVSLDFFGSVFRVIGLGLKTAVAAGIVFATVQAGLWGSPEQTEAMYRNFHKSVAPGECTPEQLELDENCIMEREIMMMVSY